MPPKKKADVKAAKAEKLKPKASVSKSPQKSVPKSKSVDKPAKDTKSKAKTKNQPAQVKSDAQVAATEARGRRGARQPSPPAPEPTPVKGKKGLKASSPPKKADDKKDPQPPKKDADNSKVKSKPTAVDDTVQEIVKLVIKGGAAVDNLVPNKQNFRVFQEAGKNYAVTLNKADLQENNNKFYLVQMLLNEKTGAIHVWNRWGRVGVPGQFCLKGPFTKDKAMADYNSKVREKTAKGYR